MAAVRCRYSKSVKAHGDATPVCLYDLDIDKISRPTNIVSNVYVLVGCWSFLQKHKGSDGE